MKWNRTLWAGLAIGCMALLTACGGGGGDDEPAAVVVADYPLRNAYTSYLATPVPEVFNLTVDIDNTRCLGSASLARSTTYNGTFRGTPSVNLTETLQFSLNSCGGQTVSPAETFELPQTLYRDASGALLGVSDTYGTSVARTPIVLPERIKVGDSATLGTFDNYDGNTLVGTTVVSYTIKPDTGSSVSVELAYETTDTAGRSIQQEAITYRLGTDGPLQLKRHQIKSSEATLVLASRS